MNSDINSIGFQSGGITHFTPSETYELCCKGAVLVDVRENYINTYKMLQVENVIYCPFSTFQNGHQEFSPDQFLIFADSAGLKSKEAALFLKRQGFADVYNMAGGMVEWERDGLPVLIDIGERLTGSCMCQLKPHERKNRKIE
jgi:rhodanese-related sulfurtransferase